MSVKTFPSQYDVGGDGGNLNSEQNLVLWMSSNVPGIPSSAILCGTSSQTNIVGTPGQASNRRYFVLDNENMFQDSKSGTTVTISGGTVIFEGYLITVDPAQMVNPVNQNYRCSIIVPVEKIESENPPIKHQPVLATFPISDSSGSNLEIPFSTIFNGTTAVQDSNFIELPILNFEILDGNVSVSDRFIKEFRIDLDSVGSNLTIDGIGEASLNDVISKITETIVGLSGTSDWQLLPINPDSQSSNVSISDLMNRSVVRSKIVDPSGSEQSGVQYLPFLTLQDGGNYELNVGYLPKADGTTKMGVVQINGTVTPGVNAGTLSVSNGILSSSAEINQNAYSVVGYGTTASSLATISATEKSDQINYVSDGTLTMSATGKTITISVAKVPEDSDQTFKSLTLKNTTLSGDTAPNLNFAITKSIGGWIMSLGGTEICRLNNGSVTFTGNQSVTGNMTVGGNIIATGTITGSKVYNAVYNDYAEFVEKDNYSSEYSVGTVIAKSIGTNNKYTICSPHNRKLVVGVCSNSYGHILGGEELEDMEENRKKYIPIGVSGRLPVRCIGRIEEGDLLIPSDSVSGVVERGHIPGMTIGKALESYNPGNKNQEGMILMQILNA